MGLPSLIGCHQSKYETKCPFPGHTPAGHTPFFFKIGHIPGGHLPGVLMLRPTAEHVVTCWLLGHRRSCEPSRTTPATALRGGGCRSCAAGRGQPTTPASSGTPGPACPTCCGPSRPASLHSASCSVSGRRHSPVPRAAPLCYGHLEFCRPVGVCLHDWP